MKDVWNKVMACKKNDTRQNLLDEIEIEKERRLWELSQYSTSELLDEIQSRKDKDEHASYIEKDEYDATEGHIDDDIDPMDYKEQYCDDYEDTATIELNDIARQNCEASPFWNSPADN